MPKLSNTQYFIILFFGEKCKEPFYPNRKEKEDIIKLVNAKGSEIENEESVQDYTVEQLMTYYNNKRIRIKECIENNEDQGPYMKQGGKINLSDSSQGIFTFDNYGSLVINNVYNFRALNKMNDIEKSEFTKTKAVKLMNSVGWNLNESVGNCCCLGAGSANTLGVTPLEID